MRPSAPPRLPFIRRDREWVPSLDAYPFSLPAIRPLTLLLHPAVTFLAGENGPGLSTPLEGAAVAPGLDAEGGGHNVTRGFLDGRGRMLGELRANPVRRA